MKQEIINQLNQLAKENEPFLFVINYEGTEAYIRKLSEIDPAACLYDFEGVSNAGTMASQPLPSSILWDVEAPLYEDYEKSFEVVERHIKAGDTHLVNLTSPVAVLCNLSLEEIFLHTQGKYKLMLKNGDQGFVCFSPETFVRINEGRIYSYPMKGTIDATLPNAEQIIMADEKEAAEHVSVVELISEDLSRVSSDVRVDCYRYVDRLHTNKGDILQTSSEVSGLLPADYPGRLGEIIDAQLPAGSITGAPKAKTVEVIREAEHYDRGYYTGIMGIYDRGNLNTGVMIRFLEQNAHGMCYKAGGGVTSQSVCRKEYEEVIRKVYLPLER